MYDYSDDVLYHRIDTFFEKRYRQGRFNGTVLMAKNGVVVYQQSFGFSNFSTKDSLHTEDAFQLASVSKTITAAAVLKLVEDGKIILDADFKMYFPNFPYDGVTIRYLLSHRSGLPNYMYFADKVWENKDSSITNADVMAIMQRDTPQPYFSPDVKYHYCNTNYALLASLIEQASGVTYEEYLQKEIFEPLGMQTAFVFNRNHSPKLPQEVLGYNTRLQLKENSYLNGVVGDKGIYASIYDLYKLDLGLRDTTFIAAQLMNEAYQPQHPERLKRQRDNYGLGWRIQFANEWSEPRFSEVGEVVYHGGWWKGFRTYFIRLIDKNACIVVLSNTTRGGYLNRKQLQHLLIDETSTPALNQNS